MGGPGHRRPDLDRGPGDATAIEFDLDDLTMDEAARVIDAITWTALDWVVDGNPEDWEHFF